MMNGIKPQDLSAEDALAVAAGIADAADVVVSAAEVVDPECKLQVPVVTDIYGHDGVLSPSKEITSEI